MKHYSAIDKRRIVERIMALAKEPNAAPLADLCVNAEITIEKFQQWKKQLGISESYISPDVPPAAPPKPKTKAELINDAIDELDRLCEGLLIAVESDDVIHFRRKCAKGDTYLLDAVSKFDPKWTVGVIGRKK